MIDHEELAAWLRLLETPGIGRETARKLLAAFGSPDAVLAASTSARQAVVGSTIATSLAMAPPHFASLLAATRRWLDGAGTDGSRDVVALGDARYPALLLQTADPPLLLYARGRIELLARPSIAMVGSRNPTAQGLENARAFAAHLGQAGFTIVSGLALGIDGAAHAGALDAGTATIAVVGTGLDVAYPLRHRALTERIAGEGLLLSEFAIGTPALSQNFPVRNRIIAGLARGTLVVEAAVQSGSLITARLAAEAGREVFAIPGSIHSPQARGCHALIRQGAKLVESGRDVLEELQAPASATDTDTDTAKASSQASSSTPVEEAAAGDPLLAALGFDPVGLDELIARTGESAAVLAARLLDLEIEGRVARLPGAQYQRIERA